MTWNVAGSRSVASSTAGTTAVNFVWTKTADQILKKADRRTTSVAVH
jgi:hypothetical protein